MSADKVTLVLPASPEFVVVARLAASGIASRSLPSVADLEDLKLAVAEACNLLIGLGANSLNIEFETREQGLEVKLTGEGCTEALPAVDSEAGLPLMLMEAVVDELEVNSRAQRTTVRLGLTRTETGQEASQ